MIAQAFTTIMAVVVFHAACGVAIGVEVAATRPATTRKVWPDASSTGPARSRVLRPSESIRVTTPGEVVEGLDVTGRIHVLAPDVIIRHCRITAGAGSVGIKIDSKATGAVIEDCEITGPESTNGVSGSNYIARRLHIHHMGSDAFRVARNVLIESSYVHDIGIAPKSHGDAVQMYPTDGGGITIRSNHFDVRGANAALFQVDNGWHVEGNYFNGGNYTIQCSGQPENKFINNTFGRDAKYGPIRVGKGERSALTWRGNAFADGAPTPLHKSERLHHDR